MSTVSTKTTKISTGQTWMGCQVRIVKNDSKSTPEKVYLKVEYQFYNYGLSPSQSVYIHRDKACTGNYAERLSLTSTAGLKGSTFTAVAEKAYTPGQTCSGSGAFYFNNGTLYGGSASNSYTVPKPTYAVTYNANGGSGAPSSQTKTYGTDLKLTTTEPTRNGYAFQGWATSSTSTTVAYAAGATYTANQAITLYAVWTATITTPTTWTIYNARRVSMPDDYTYTTSRVVDESTANQASLDRNGKYVLIKFLLKEPQLNIDNIAATNLTYSFSNSDIASGAFQSITWQSTATSTRALNHVYILMYINNNTSKITYSFNFKAIRTSPSVTSDTTTKQLIIDAVPAPSVQASWSINRCNTDGILNPSGTKCRIDIQKIDATLVYKETNGGVCSYSTSYPGATVNEITSDPEPMEEFSPQSNAQWRVLTENFDLDSAYSITLAVKDSFGTQKTFTLSLPKAFKFLTLSGPEKSLAIGGSFPSIIEDETIYLQSDTEINGTLNINEILRTPPVTSNGRYAAIDGGDGFFKLVNPTIDFEDTPSSGRYCPALVFYGKNNYQTAYVQADQSTENSSQLVLMAQRPINGVDTKASLVLGVHDSGSKNFVANVDNFTIKDITGNFVSTSTSGSWVIIKFNDPQKHVLLYSTNIESGDFTIASAATGSILKYSDPITVTLPISLPTNYTRTIVGLCSGANRFISMYSIAPSATTFLYRMNLPSGGSTASIGVRFIVLGREA